MTAQFWEYSEALTADEDRIPLPIPGQRRYPKPVFGPQVPDETKEDTDE